MQEINKTVFDLDEVFKLISHGKVQLMLDKLLIVKSELEDSKRLLLLRCEKNDVNSATITFITEQLLFLDKNVKTLGDAILCHETKTFEKRTSKVIKTPINLCLN